MASVADLVEPEGLRERAGEYLERAGQVLRESGRVQLVELGPVRVLATVDDGGVRTVRLESGSDGLVVACDCEAPAASGWCPHAVATAIETWHRAPPRR
ncbi:MAG: hypothetical protein E6I26_01775 [Chloroflexi bacterium]|nr:MAG: hypothetical protein E6I26_01775 [Chloroflexota bacterium]